MNKYEDLTTEDLINEFIEIKQELRNRQILRTDNFVGDLGEYLVKNIYNNNPILSNLSLLNNSYPHYDAQSEDGNRYSIKTITTNYTGKFTGLEPKNSIKENSKLFDYVVVCQCDKNLAIKLVLELTWENFLKYKKWHSTDKAWYLSVTKKLIKNSNIIIDNRKN